MKYLYVYVNVTIHKISANITYLLGQHQVGSNCFWSWRIYFRIYFQVN